MNSPDRRTPPPIKDAVGMQYSLPPLHSEVLPNGTPMHHFAGGVQDVVEVDWVFPAGVWYEAKPAVAAVTAALLKGGTAKHSAHAFVEAFEFFGAHLKVSPGDDWSMVTLHCLTKHLPQLLPLVKEMLTEAVFPEAEVALYKQTSIDRLLVSLRQCEFVANQQIDALIYGPAHPYGRFTRREKIEALTREDLVGHYHRCYNLGAAQIFAGGKLGDTGLQAIRETFGTDALKREPIAEETFAPAPPAERTHRTINDPAGVQGAVRIGRTFIPRTHPDWPGTVVLNTLFGGYFGSRLMSNIREDKGYTYGIYSSVVPALRGSSFVIHTEVGRDVAEAAVAEIYKEMEALCAEPASEEELLLVKNYLLGGLLGDLDGPFQVLARWRSLILAGLGEEYFNRNIGVYKSIGAEALQALAVKYLARKEEFYEVVVV